VLQNILSQHLKVKYKRTLLGYVWSLLNPVLQLIVLTLVFSHVVRLEMGNYTQFLFSGLLAWSFFANSLVSASTSLLESENFIKKIYLPKMIFPLSKVLLVGVDFLFSLLALTVIGAVIGFKLHATIALLPLAMLSLLSFTMGLSVFVAVATVFFRDVQYLLGIFLNLMYFLTPVIYPVTALPENYRVYMQLNPVALQIGLFQKLIYYGQFPSAQEWAVALTISMTSLVLGLTFLSLADEELVFRL